jgi:hypothetical protein
MLNPPQELEALFPYRGACLLCGGDDARHRITDEIESRLSAGDSVEDIALDLDVDVAIARWIDNKKPPR